MDGPVVMVGAGLAAVTAAETLRDEGFGGPIRLIERERQLPYLRPPLSKGLLGGSEDEDTIRIQPPEWYDQQGIELLLGREAVVLDRARRVVELGDGSAVPYGRLLLATGSSPRRLPIPNADLPGVHLLRTLDDSRRLQAALVADPGAEPRRLVVVGSGWIGMEVAAVARTSGADVTVVGLETVPLSAAVGREIGDVFRRRHERAGVRFRPGQTAAAVVARDGRAAGVLLGSGETLPADVVLVAVGVAPNTALGMQAGLDSGNGLRVGGDLTTNDPAIWAAGDVAEVHRPRLGRGERLEHWANAIATGRAAARSMLGLGAGEQETPYFYTDQFDLGMEWWGHPSLAAGASLVVRGDLASEAFVAFLVQPEPAGGARVVAGLHVNVWDAADEIRSLVEAEAVLPVEALRGGPAARRGAAG
ncbi:FAD-dependent oxidoreductase [Amnibacterium sp. CER49]|uniref:NAD(P)/FAD-dependent oxidoreductase n=1 Tax=Amnibacterium sp. CER49 TaxID=3039161 RepID=UPI00244C765D|nr:FAD-dependent oxidoreductase [Amnibacterium sp. CER49]MDH2443370.1 FAD-dependent oxidoreductase [Amnibacterium sp. CER49]